MTADVMGTAVTRRSVVGWYQPADWKHRATAADPTLPHQIVLTVSGAAGHRLQVTCNCQIYGHGPRCARLGFFDTLGQAWAVYDAHLPAQATA